MEEDLEDEGRLVFETEVEPEESGDIGLGTMQENIPLQDMEPGSVDNEISEEQFIERMSETEIDAKDDDSKVDIV